MSDRQAVPAKRGPGRPTAKPLTAFVKARVSQAEHDKYIALGGSEWLRKQIAGAPEPLSSQLLDDN